MIIHGMMIIGMIIIGMMIIGMIIIGMIIIGMMMIRVVVGVAQDGVHLSAQLPPTHRFLSHQFLIIIIMDHYKSLKQIINPHHGPSFIEHHHYPFQKI